MGSMTGQNRNIDRRDFLKTGAAAASGIVGAGTFSAPAFAKSTSPNEKLDIAMVGVGGKGFDNVRSVQRENIVALCDVDEERAGKAFDLISNAKRYSDYRTMLEKENKNIDAVVVTTPDHVHIPVTMMALGMGKHVYCEKPLGHNVREVRMVTECAKKAGLATQLGNTNHSSSNYRGIAELVKAGTLGDVKEVHIWCDNEWDPAPRVAKKASTLSPRDRWPSDTPAVPENLNWNLWLGPAPVRPYHPAYHPISWRGWWDFGNGRLGDMGCHLIDLPFMALDLTSPLTVEAQGPHRAGLQAYPSWLISKWTFGARGGRPPVEMTWYDGNKQPDLPEGITPAEDVWPWYVALVGTEGTLVAGISSYKMYPEEKFAGVELPEVPRIGGHHKEWITACKTGSSTGTNFDYAGPLSETVLLGTVAYRVGKKLEWDPANLKATNAPEADQFIRREEYREGWTL